MELLEDHPWRLAKLADVHLICLALVRIFHRVKVDVTFVRVRMIQIIVLEGILPTAKCKVDPLMQIIGDVCTLQGLSMLYQEVLGVLGPRWQLHVVDAFAIYADAQI